MFDLQSRKLNDLVVKRVTVGPCLMLTAVCAAGGERIARLPPLTRLMGSRLSGHKWQPRHHRDAVMDISAFKLLLNEWSYVEDYLYSTT